MPNGFTDIPSSARFRLTNARVPLCLLDPLPAAVGEAAEGLALVDIEIQDGKVSAIAPAGSRHDTPEAHDLDGGQVWPCFVDLHTHLDKGHIWPRQPNPDNSHVGALQAVAKDRSANWSADDLAQRMDFSLRTAYAHGTAAIRTHIDSMDPQYKISWPVIDEVRRSWADRIQVQAVSLVHMELYRDAELAKAVADTVAEYGGVFGAVALIHEGLDGLLDMLFGLAIERGLGFDFHVDETKDPESSALEAVARAALRHKFEHRIVVGHCCSIAQKPDDQIDRALDLVAEAGLHVVSLPMCNMFLQDRGAGRTPRWRGVTLLHEMKARGIPVSIASDNTRDPFYGYGDLDGVEIFTQAARIAHLDRPVGDWPAAVTRTPADTMGLTDVGRLAVGGPADMVLFRARHYSELLSRPQADRVVLRAGRAIDTTPPDYRELDDLFAAAG